MNKVNHKVHYVLIATQFGAFRVKFVWDARDKAYLVSIPRLPGAVTFGTSFTEAKKMAKEVIELHCDCLIDEGELVRDDRGRILNPVGSKVRITAASL